MTAKIPVPVAFFQQDLTDHDWERLQGAAGVTFSTEQRNRLQSAYISYQTALAADSGYPRAASVRKTLKGLLPCLAEAQTALVTLLDGSANAQGVLHSIRLETFRDGDRSISEERVKAVYGELAIIAMGAHKALASVPFDKGRPRNPGIGPLNVDATEIFNAAGGKPAKRLSFLRTLAKIVGANVHSNESLSRVADKTLNAQRKKVSQKRPT